MQAAARVLGACYTGTDQVDPGLLSGKVTMRISLCFNASGVSITNENNVVTSHGQYLGWSTAEQRFGFVNGTACEAGTLGNKITIGRAAKVRVGCCSANVIYYTKYGKWLASPRVRARGGMRQQSGCSGIWVHTHTHTSAR